MNEFKKMINGKIYDPLDPNVLEKRSLAHDRCAEFNSLRETDARREEIIKEFWPNSKSLYLQGPIYFDYMCNTSFGDYCYANFNFTVLDCAPVTIGNNVFFGPNVAIYTPVHPFLPSERNLYKNEKGIYTDREYAKPITIEDDCWICGNVTIVGGVKIGKGTIIGAGSVVTKDIPSGVIAAGNPCKVIRKITENDSIYLKKHLF